MLNFRNFLEATQTYVKKLLDPALLTYDEYYKLVNPNDKFHSSTAYSFSLEDNHRPKYDKNDYPEKIKTIKINGTSFEFRLKKEDRLNFKYVKTDKNGEIITDENGKALYVSEDELLKLFKDKRYKYSIGVFNEDGIFIGGSQDEWGAMLIRIADEYRGWGLGTILSKMARTLEPDKSSGGFTPAGHKTFKKVHTEFVRDYLASGMYSHLINTGQITLDRVKKIINSVDLNKPKSYSNKNLGSNDPKDWLLYADDDIFIIYDKKLKDIEDNDHFWLFKMIKGMVFYRIDNYCRIKVFGGENDKIKKYLLNLAIADASQEGIWTAIEPDDINYVDRNLEIEPISVKAGYKSYLVKNPNPNLNIKLLGLPEKQFRKSFDRYDEFLNKMLELAYGKYQD